ncbi:hypothetical protein E3O44_13145 [Cryobacterium algoricola]|uniref:Uncharacterized protein n=1 Tax=Cryobacterium algoricola TaxID=1259183 RepID=A0ABY2IA14_9MICO|nr:hypothetical protein [Cryobacterium algoricola]TFB85538.1 hypothetical protein E3O44_13145 [Cryobacterium algoricola]
MSAAGDFRDVEREALLRRSQRTAARTAGKNPPPARVAQPATGSSAVVRLGRSVAITFNPALLSPAERSRFSRHMNARVSPGKGVLSNAEYYAQQAFIDVAQISVPTVSGRDNVDWVLKRGDGSTEVVPDFVARAVQPRETGYAGAAAATVPTPVAVPPALLPATVLAAPPVTAPLSGALSTAAPLVGPLSIAAPQFAAPPVAAPQFAAPSVAAPLFAAPPVAAQPARSDASAAALALAAAAETAVAQAVAAQAAAVHAESAQLEAARVAATQTAEARAAAHRAAEQAEAAQAAAAEVAVEQSARVHAAAAQTAAAHAAAQVASEHAATARAAAAQAAADAAEQSAAQAAAEQAAAAERSVAEQAARSHAAAQAAAQAAAEQAAAATAHAASAYASTFARTVQVPVPLAGPSRLPAPPEPEPSAVVRSAAESAARVAAQRAPQASLTRSTRVPAAPVPGGPIVPSYVGAVTGSQMLRAERDRAREILARATALRVQTGHKSTGPNYRAALISENRARTKFFDLNAQTEQATAREARIEYAAVRSSLTEGTENYRLEYEAQLTALASGVVLPSLTDRIAAAEAIVQRQDEAAALATDSAERWAAGAAQRKVNHTE